MISKQAVYLNEDRTKAVAEGDPKARFLLVREGHEIEESLAEKYDGALDLIGSASKVKAKEPETPALPTLKGDTAEAAAPADKPARKKAAKKSAK